MRVLSVSTIGCFCLLAACEPQEWVEKPDWHATTLSDSTFFREYALPFIDSSATVGNDLMILPLSSHEGEAIRVWSHSGWGTFDAMATFYRKEVCVGQMVIQTANAPARGFQIREFMVPEKECDSIFQLVSNDQFFALPFDLEPSNRILDGNIYSVSYHGSEYKHVVTWQLQSGWGEPEENEQLISQKRAAEKIYHDLFQHARRPVPCPSIYYRPSESDSVTYLVPKEFLNDFIHQVSYDCTNCIVKYSDYGNDTIRQAKVVDEYGYIQSDIRSCFYTSEGVELEGECRNLINLEEAGQVN